MRIEDKLFLDRFHVNDEPHLRIMDVAICMEKCPDQPCLYFCPANVYRMDRDRIRVAYEGCIECGSCRIACPHLNIDWQFPKGGYGISHKFG